MLQKIHPNEKFEDAEKYIPFILDALLQKNKTKISCKQPIKKIGHHKDKEILFSIFKYTQSMV